MVGIFGTLEYCDDPGYLKKLLTDYKNRGNQISVYDNFDLNKNEYNQNFNKLCEFYKKNMEALQRHISTAANNNNNIAIVDMTTGKFASMYFASNILKDRLKFGFYSYTWKDAGT